MAGRMRFPFVFVVALATVAPSDAPAGAAATAPPSHPDATSIYERARDAVDALAVPTYIAFTEQDLSSGRDGFLQEQVRIVVRTSDGHAIVRRLRDYNGDPVSERPRVVTTPLYPVTIIYRVGDFPLADFGMRRTTTRPGIFEASGTPEPAATGEVLRTLTTVRVSDLAYRLTDLGDETLGARIVYHLGLEPLRDPGHHVLRELWIDRETSLPVRYVAERFVGMAGMPFRYLVTVDAAMYDGHLVNVEADGRFDVHRALVIRYAGEGHWKIADVGFPASVPDWAFDPSEYAEHGSENVPGL
jgi:hypothetical protein